MGRLIDLHFHIDGAITPEIAGRLAALQEIPLPKEESLEKLLRVPADCQDLNDFLKCFELPKTLLQTPEGLSEAVRLEADHIASQGVIYAEMRFAPQLHTDRGMTQEEAVQAALRGMKKTSLKTNLILCLMRGGSEKDNFETIDVARRHLVPDGGVVAVDLAGAEALFPTDLYRDIFAKAREYGIPFTIHAGEAAGADSVRLAVEYGAARIGHGVRIHEDPEVVKMIKERGIPLEMCPTSNRQTHAVSDMSRYPLIDYLRQGLRVTINTDDMGIEGTTLADEFLYIKEKFGLTDEEEEKLLMNAVDAAFTTDVERDKMRNRIRGE